MQVYAHTGLGVVMQVCVYIGMCLHKCVFGAVPYPCSCVPEALSSAVPAPSPPRRTQVWPSPKEAHRYVKVHRTTRLAGCQNIGAILLSW